MSMWEALREVHETNSNRSHKQSMTQPQMDPSATISSNPPAKTSGFYYDIYKISYYFLLKVFTLPFHSKVRFFLVL